LQAFFAAQRNLMKPMWGMVIKMQSGQLENHSISGGSLAAYELVQKVRKSTDKRCFRCFLYNKIQSL